MARLITHSYDLLTDLTWIEKIWQKPVQRFFWIYNVPPSGTRGGHHHQSYLMVLHCLMGSVDVYVQSPTDDQFFTLDADNQYLFLDAKDWRLMHRFSSDAVLMVFASKPYESTRYFNQPYRTIHANQINTDMHLAESN